MKKRKELDALVAAAKVGAAKRACSARELLRTDSSDMEDYAVRRKGRKKHGDGYFCMTSVCLSLCQFVLVLSSCAVSAALIYLHIGLREELDLLRAHLQKVEAGNRNTPEALHVIHSNLKQLDSNVTTLYIDMRKNGLELENITAEVVLLKTVANSLKASVAAAPTIAQLPKDMHALSESVAGFGSKLNALESNVKELKDQQSNLLAKSQNLSGELDTVKTSMQELSSSTDVQARSFSGESSKESKSHNELQEISQHVNFLQEQLTKAVTSLDSMNSTFTSHSNSFNEFVLREHSMNDAIVYLNNVTLAYNAQFQSLVNFVHSNLTSRLEVIETDGGSSLPKSTSVDVEEYLNKTITDALLHLGNKVIFNSNVLSSANVTEKSIQQTHDYLVLLAALLQKFEGISSGVIHKDKSAADVVEEKLQSIFKQMLLPANNKLQDIEKEVRHISECFPCSTNQTISPSKQSSFDTT